MSNQKWITAIAVVFALVIVVGASAQTGGNNHPSPSQWEHLALTIDLENDIKTAGRQINQLGDDGWQLVDVENFVSGGDTTKTVYYFKRPQ